MKKNRESGTDQPKRLELKYCEHCGSLWVRERGAGVVYCDQCQPKVHDLPVAVSKKRSRRVSLPVRRHTAIDDYQRDENDDDGDMEAVGGAA
jgi:ribosomal protein L37AE/L43A